MSKTHYKPANEHISVVEEEKLPDSVTPAVLVVRYQRDANSPEFFFHVRSNRIVVSTKPPGEPWHKKLNPQEQMDIFQYILAEYRLRSEGDNKWKGAAIGVTGGEHPQLYIGMNTKRQDPFHKDCAESNVVNNVEVIDSLAERDAPQGGEFSARLTQMYIMGGREPKGNDSGSLINCPCGKCTDILKNHMPSGSNVFALPIPQQEQLQKLEVVSSGNETYQKFGAIETLVKSGKPVAWQTTIDHLNENKVITLDGKTVAAQRDALTGLADRISILPQARAEKALGFSLEEFQKREGKAKSFIEKMFQPVADLPKEVAIALKAAENILFARNSIAQIDVEGGTDTLQAVNHYMVNQIETTIANRVASENLPAEKVGKGESLDAKGRKISRVRCVVIQLSDGTFHSGVDVDSGFDNATPQAEMNAITHALPNLVKAKVAQVWAMEFDPKNIETKVMETSPKEGLERILKRAASPSALKLTFIPFNGGESQDLAKVSGSIKPFGISDIFPSSFAGNQLAAKN